MTGLVGVSQDLINHNIGGISKMRHGTTMIQDGGGKMKKICACTAACDHCRVVGLFPIPWLGHTTML